MHLLHFLIVYLSDLFVIWVLGIFLDVGGPNESLPWALNLIGPALQVTIKTILYVTIKMFHHSAVVPLFISFVCYFIFG